MKKKVPAKRLTVSRETVRVLEAAALSAAAGGGFPYTTSSSIQHLSVEESCTTCAPRNSADPRYTVCAC